MWKDLSIQEKAALINIGVKNGLYDLEDIKNSYNKYAGGGYKPSSRIKKQISDIHHLQIRLHNLLRYT